MKFNKWSWGYLPVALVLGLIWFEFWRSAGTPQQPKVVSPETQDAPTPIIAAGNDGPGPGVTPTLTPTPVPVGPGPGVVPNPPIATATTVKPIAIDDKFFDNPPPITIDVSNVPLTGVVDAMRTAFNMPCYLDTYPPNGTVGGNDRFFTIKAKDTPFWEVVKQLQAQGQLGFYPGNSGAGLVLSTQYNSVYRFQTSGPAILYPTTITYSRNINPQNEPVQRMNPAYNISFGAAVDPRILVARTGPVEVVEATDDSGRAIAVQNTSSSGSVGTNFWNTSISVPPPAQKAKSLNLKCQLHFSAQLPSGSTTLADATQKIGEVITLGDRKFRLNRLETQGSILYIQISSEDGIPGEISASVTDTNNRTYSFTGNTNAARTLSAPNLVAPLKLTLRDPTAVRDCAYSFEFKDIPLP